MLTVGGRNLVSVKSIRRCNAINTSGCRRPVPSAPVGEYLLSADPATNTIYAGNLSQPQIDVINGATCHAADLSGCTPVAEIPMPDPQANVGQSIRPLTPCTPPTSPRPARSRSSTPPPATPGTPLAAPRARPWSRSARSRTPR